MVLSKLKLLSIPILIFPILVLADQGANNIADLDFPFVPWFTGPFLTTTAINMEPGRPAIEPSITVFWNYGEYTNSWELETGNPSVTINPFLDFQFAITQRTGVEIQAQSFTVIRDGQSTTNYADTNILFGYQVSNDQKDTWIPDFRVLLEVVFPTGKYDKLNPGRNFDDVTGQGAYFLGPNVSYQKLYYLRKSHFVFHWAIGYLFPSRASIKDLSAYGGTKGTKGKIRPGQILTTFFAGEYSLNEKWALGFETSFFYQFSSSKFEGDTGIEFAGMPASVGLDASAQWMLLPEVQYIINDNSGLLFGGWFSLMGKNTTAYAGGFLAYLYVF